MAQKWGGRIRFFGPKGKTEKSESHSAMKMAIFTIYAPPPVKISEFSQKGGVPPPFWPKMAQNDPFWAPFGQKGGGTPPFGPFLGSKMAFFGHFWPKKGGFLAPLPGPFNLVFRQNRVEKGPKMGADRFGFLALKAKTEKKPYFSRSENGHFFGLGTPPRENFRIFAKGGGYPPLFGQKGAQNDPFWAPFGQKGGVPPLLTQKVPKMTHFGPLLGQKGGVPPFGPFLGSKRGGTPPLFWEGGYPPLRTLFWVQKRGGGPLRHNQSQNASTKICNFCRGWGVQLTLRTISQMV